MKVMQIRQGETLKQSRGRYPIVCCLAEPEMMNPAFETGNLAWISLRHGPGENGKVVDMTKIKNFKIPIFPTSPDLGLSKEPSTRFLGASVLLLEPIE